MKKIIKNSLIILVLLILITGCGKKNIKIVNMGNTTSSRNNNPAYNINVYGSGTLNCTRDASAYSGLNATFNYGVVYKNGIINEIHSIEKVKGNDTKALDEYEDAYNDIKKRYKNLDYYTITVTQCLTNCAYVFFLI